ncbi:MAG TPA: hypothetical protein VGO34_16195 [Alphaproteobacteria bacterium]
MLVSTAVFDASAQEKARPDMSFFVTSAGSGKGGDLGGLAGADKICQALGQSAGAGGKTWHAYLSTQAAGGQPAVNARDRIGKGPWQNAMGVAVARSVADLHDGNNNLGRYTALNEKGMMVNGRGDKPNTHDILTGSQPDGTAFPPGEDMTCSNWTSSGPEGGAMLGHHDRSGLDDSAVARSWNSTHRSRGGCGVEALRSSGGAGLLYCFAAN